MIKACWRNSHSEAVMLKLQSTSESPAELVKLPFAGLHLKNLIWGEEAVIFKFAASLQILLMLQVQESHFENNPSKIHNSHLHVLKIEICG